MVQPFIILDNVFLSSFRTNFLPIQFWYFEYILFILFISNPKAYTCEKFITHLI